MRRSKDTPSKNKPKFLAEKIFNGERWIWQKLIKKINITFILLSRLKPIIRKVKSKL